MKLLLNYGHNSPVIRNLMKTALPLCLQIKAMHTRMYACTQSYPWQENISRLTKASSQNGSNSGIKPAQTTSSGCLCTFNHITSCPMIPFRLLDRQCPFNEQLCNVLLYHRCWRQILFPYYWELIKPYSEDRMNHFHFFLFVLFFFFSTASATDVTKHFSL